MTPPLRTALWLLIAWPLPAAVAGALGWSGVWGSGSALFDFLIPVPVAGGALHVPSFVLTTLVVLHWPKASAANAQRLRGLLVGMALAGGLWLLDLTEVLQAWHDGSALPYRLSQANPLGLFVLCDALVALLAFTPARAHAPRTRGRPDALALLLCVAPAALPVATAWPKSAAEQPFVKGMARNGPQRGDETLMVYTRLSPTATDFKARALDWASQPAQMLDPAMHVDTEDMAVLFTTQHTAAQRFQTDQAALTLCLYEDGTPPQWLPGAGDCFGPHQSFNDLLQAEHARPSGAAATPQERLQQALQALCQPGDSAAPVTPGHPPTTRQALCGQRLH